MEREYFSSLAKSQALLHHTLAGRSISCHLFSKWQRSWPGRLNFPFQKHPADLSTAAKAFLLQVAFDRLKLLGNRHNVAWSLHCMRTSRNKFMIPRVPLETCVLLLYLHWAQRQLHQDIPQQILQLLDPAQICITSQLAISIQPMQQDLARQSKNRN